MTRRTNGRALETTCETLNRLIVGWVNYYALADMRGHSHRLDQWLRRRLRQLYWKQWKTPANRYHHLRQLGVSDHWAKLNAGTSRGCWRLAKSPVIHHALNNAFWNSFGLKTFVQQYLLRQT